MGNTLITEIRRFSLEDGPGIRTVVFFKGCPLRCAWCHNPECLSYEAEVLFYSEKCIHCGGCEAGCYSGARVTCGKSMTPEEVMAVIREDKAYYGKEGGVTLSGGEPLSHREFALAIADACQREGISLGIETSLYRYDDELLSRCNVLMTDVKLMDSALHKKYVGAGNEEILHNLQRADALGIPIIVRTPVVPGVNDTKENIAATAAFLKGLHHLVSYELLPYHPLGLSKAAALGKSMTEFPIPTNEKMKELRRYADISR